MYNSSGIDVLFVVVTVVILYFVVLCEKVILGS